MKSIAMRAALAAVALVCAAAQAQPLPATTAAAAGFSPEGLQRLDRFFAREIDARRVPGAVVAIARDGKLVHYKTYGVQDPATGTPMPLDAVFGLASMTKIMATVGALQLNEEGRLPLKSRLSDYYPGFASMKVGVAQPDGSLKLVDQARPIFIQDLMRHTSGLTYGGRGDHPIAKLYPGGTTPPSEGDIGAFIERLTRLPLAHQPGTAFEYSFSTDVLGAVVEKVTGQRLGEYLQARVWQPLRMPDTTFALSDRIRPRLARPFPNNPLVAGRSRSPFSTGR